MRLFARALAALACVLLIDAAAAQDVPVGPGQVYVQGPTGMTFPAQVGPFQRTRVYRYAADGSDESAGYNLIRSGAEVAATVYVYPSPRLEIGPGSEPATVAAAQALLCSTHFEGVQQEIEGAYRDETLVSEGAATLNNALGFTAVYNFTTDNFMGRRARLRSEAHLFCFVGGSWSVKYRFSYPADYDASADIAAFMRDLAWTIGQASKT